MNRFLKMRFNRGFLRGRRGITLMELLIASIIGLFVLAAFTGIDLSRIYLTNEANANAGFQTNVAYSLGHIARELMDADRVVLLSSSNMQIRRAVGADPNAAASYDWTQYRYDSSSDTLLLYQDTDTSCSGSLLAENITSVQFEFSDESVSPPGGEPFSGEDNNMLRITITSQDPLTQNQLTMRSTVAIRISPYSNVSAGFSGNPDPLPAPGACT